MPTINIKEDNYKKEDSSLTEVMDLLRVISNQNTAILARQGCIGAMLLAIGESDGEPTKTICNKCYRQMMEDFDKYYVEPLKEMMEGRK